MAKAKQAVLKKPVLSSEAVTAFAEGRPTTQATSKARAVKASPSVADAVSTSRFPPSGDVRLTVNMRGDLHMRLKMEAVKNRTTVGEILEAMVEKHIKG